MSTHQALAGQEPFVLDAQEGDHYHFLNHVATVKVAAGTDRSMSVVEFLGTRGFGPPLHRHDEEDELFVIVEGELMFHTGDERILGGPGSMAYLPRAIPHTFQVMSDAARFINVTSSPGGPPRFDQMISALGVATVSPTMPEPVPIDPGHVAEVCARYGIPILGPPPPPLD